MKLRGKCWLAVYQCQCINVIFLQIPVMKLGGKPCERWYKCKLNFGERIQIKKIEY